MRLTLEPGRVSFVFRGGLPAGKSSFSVGEARVVVSSVAACQAGWMHREAALVGSLEILCNTFLGIVDVTLERLPSCRAKLVQKSLSLYGIFG